MDIRRALNFVEKFAVDNSPTIFTMIGVTGTLATAYLTGKATFRATQILNEEQQRIDLHEQGHPLDNREKLRLVWKQYIPAGAAILATTGAIVAANQIGSRRTAAIAAAYTITEHAFTEYRDKVADRLGHQKEQAIRDEIARDHILAHPPSNQIIVVGSGVICFDEMSGRYFTSDMETIRKAMNDVNYKINNHLYASLSDFYDLIGLEHTMMSDDIGWNSDNLLNLRFSSVLSEDGRPAMSISYDVWPIRGYARVN